MLNAPQTHTHTINAQHSTDTHTQHTHRLVQSQCLSTQLRLVQSQCVSTQLRLVLGELDPKDEQSL